MKVFLVKGFTADCNDTYLVSGVYSNLNAAKRLVNQLVDECKDYIDDEFIECNPIINTEERYSNNLLIHKTISVTMDFKDERNMSIFKYNMIGSLQISEDSYRSMKVSANCITFNLLDLKILLTNVID